MQRKRTVKVFRTERTGVSNGLWSFVVWVLVLLTGGFARAQTVQQSFDLKAGWNAVYLEIDAEPSVLDDVLAGLAVNSVWVRDDGGNGERNSDCAEESGDAACLASTETGWHVWFPMDAPQHVIRSLRDLSGGRVYLIEMAEPAPLSVSGRPNVTVTRWRKGFDLGGFHVVSRAENAPTFATYLGASSVHQDADIFEVDADGALSRVSDPGATQITPGRGYWVSTARNAVYDGPVRIDSRSLRGAEFRPGTAEHFIEIENLNGALNTVTLTNTATLAPEGASAQRDSGETKLKWYDFGDGASAQWHALDSVNVELKSRGTSGAKRTIRLGVDRTEASQGGLEADGQDSYEGLLRVTDESGYRRWIPVASRGGGQGGLWVGDVTVNQVRSLTSGDAAPTPTASDFVFRIIIHRGASEYVLLREAVLVYREVEQDHVLVTPSCFDLLEGSGPSPRVSSANFAFDGDIEMTGDFATQLEASIATAATDSLNPFLHPFNPIHAEGFATTRNISLRFDPDGGGDPEWGVTRLAGTYEEILLGLHRSQIEARGRFDLRRVSSIGTLCGP